MGTTLTGTFISQTYDSLIKVTDNDNLTSTAKRLTDGLGNDSPLFLSTTRLGVGVTPTTTFQVAGNSQLGGNLTVTGNLIVQGTTTTVDTDTLSVKDPLIIVGSDNRSSDAVDLGFYGVYDTSGSLDLYAGLYRDASDAKFHLFKDLQTEPTTTVNKSATGYTVATLVSNLEGNVTGNVTGNVSGSAATVTGAAQTAITSLGTLTALQVDNININGNTISSTAGTDLNITPLAGQQIVLDGTIVIDAGVVTGATSITSTAFVGALTGDVTGNADTATKIASITNSNIVQLTSSQTLTNKTIDLDNNTVSNIEVDNLKSGVLDTDLSSVSGSDDTLASAKAIKTYVDAQVDTADTLAEILAIGNTTGGTDIAVSSNDDITFADNSKSIYGAGTDLQIYSDGTVGNIKGDDVRLVNASGENIFRVNGDAAELYYNDSKKLETTSTGVSVTGNGVFSGNVSLADNKYLSIGTDSGDAFNTNSAIRIQDSADAHIQIKTATTGQAGILIGDTDDDYVGGFIYSNDTNTLTFKQNNVDALTISGTQAATFAGKILVGTGATAAASLNAYTQTVSSNLFSALRVIENSGASSYWDIGATGGSSTLLNFYHNGNTTPKISFTHTGGATFAGDVAIGGTANSYSNQTVLTINGSTYGRLDLESGGTLRSSLFAGSSNTTLDVASGFFTIDVGSERLRIDTSGNVGIGTASPNKKLEILSTASDHLRLAFSGSAYWDLFQNAADGSFRILKDNGSLFTFAQSGNLGIGTTSPQAELSIGTNIGTFNGISIGATANRDIRIGQSSTNNLILGWKYNATASSAYGILETFGGSNSLVLQSAGGNVGIGTTSPNAKLDILGASSDQLRLRTAESEEYKIGRNSTTGLLEFYGTQSGYTGYVFGGVNGTRLTIDSSGNATFSGNVTINGTLSGAGSFVPVSGGTFTGNITFGAANPFQQTTNVLDGTGTDGARIRSAVSSATNPTFSNSDDTNTGMYFSAADTLDFTTGGTQALSIDSSQNATFAGNVSLGDDKKILLGAGDDFRLDHDGSNSFINNLTGAFILRQSQDDGNIAFQCDDGSGGVTEYFRLDGGSEQNVVSKNMRFEDSIQCQFGAGTDLRIYHNGSNSFIQDTGTGGLVISTSLLEVYNAAVDEFMIVGTENGAVDLYHNGSKKFETTANGVNIVDSELGIGAGHGTSSAGNAVVFAPYGLGTNIAGGELQFYGGRSTGTAAGGSIKFYTSPTGSSGSSANSHIQALSIDSSQNATFAGNISIAGGHGFANDGNGDLEISSGSSDSMNIISNGSMSIRTGGNNERLGIDSSGRVGIGTTSPAVLLHVTGSAEETFRLDNSGDTAAIHFRRGGVIKGILGYSNGSTIASAADADDMVLRAEGTKKLHLANSGDVALTVDTNENVGIGTTSPSTALEVIGDIKIKEGSGHSNYALLDASEALLTLETYSVNTSSFAADIIFKPAGTERMRIADDGNVGIGTTSPSQKLDVNGATNSKGLLINGLHTFGASSAQSIELNNAATSYGVIRAFQGTDATGVIHFFGRSWTGGSSVGMVNIEGHNGVSIGTWNSPSTSTTFLTSGNVGIGTASPDFDLDVAGSIGIDDKIYHNGDHNTFIGFGADTQTFRTGGSDRVTINNTGVGIGNTSPQADLHVGPTQTVSSDHTSGFGNSRFFIVNGNNGGSGVFQQGSSAANIIMFGKDTANTAIGFYNSDISTNQSTVGSITTTSSATAFNTSSDYRLKEDYKDFDGLSMIDKINVYDFAWKKDKSRAYGVKAHELEEVLPQAVNGEKDAAEMQQVDYSKLVPVLLKSIQELKKEIEILKNK